MARSLVLLLLAVAAACDRSRDFGFPRDAQWIDLTHDFSSATIYWPTAKPFKLDVVSAQQTPAGYYYAANNFSAAEHGGTHLDAPIHFAEGKWTADQIPLNRLTGDAVLVDVEPRAAGNADYRID